MNDSILNKDDAILIRILTRVRQQHIVRLHCLALEEDLDKLTRQSLRNIYRGEIIAIEHLLMDKYDLVPKS